MRLLIDFPRWLLLASLVYAPWAFGCVHERCINILVAAMLVTTALWLIGCLARRRWPWIHPVCLAAALFLLFQGWGMILNAEYYYDHLRFEFVRIPQLLAFAPGVLDAVESVPMMLRITGLLGIICFVCDLAGRPHWRLRLWWTIGLNGVAFILWGLEQRVVQAVWWSEAGYPSTTFFARYFYTANAGAFVNLVLPSIVGLAILSLRTRFANLQRAMWVPGALICLAGAIAAASKAAMVVTAILVAAFGLEEMTSWWRRRTDSVSLGTMSLRLLAVAVLVLAVGAVGWDAAFKRWEDPVWVEKSWGARWLTYQACATMLSDAGAWGFGPGNFRISFPHYTDYFGGRIKGIWDFAHQDYLQTLIEWGWVGAAVWSILFFGGFGVGCRYLWMAGQRLGRADRLLLFASVLALIGVALHALVDFPLQIASLQLYAAAFVGLVWSSATWLKSTSKTQAAG